jgi:hypothetical protein
VRKADWIEKSEDTLLLFARVLDRIRWSKMVFSARVMRPKRGGILAGRLYNP